MTLRHLRSLMLLTVLATLVTAAGLIGQAQQPATAPAANAAAGADPATAPLTAKIPVDRRITTGVLPNGLKYYIRANKKPENRAELRLVVNAGSVLEDDDQQGLAHFVEHMAFNGTKNFPKHEHRGVHGVDRHALRAERQRVHELRRDGLHAADPDRQSARSSSGRFSSSTTGRTTSRSIRSRSTRNAASSSKSGGCAAARRAAPGQAVPGAPRQLAVRDRMPIGKTDILQKFRHDRLKKFYTDWYRPDLMAVIAVGDFDPADMEAMIRTRFSEIPRPASPKPRPVYTVPARPGTSYSIATDPELAGTQVSVYHTKPAQDESTIGAYRDRIVVGLFSGMLNLRFVGDRPEAGRAVPRRRRVPGRARADDEATMLSAAVRRRKSSAAWLRSSTRPNASRGSASRRRSSTARSATSQRAHRARGRSRRTTTSRPTWQPSTAATTSRASRSPASSTRTRCTSAFSRASRWPS